MSIIEKIKSFFSGLSSDEPTPDPKPAVQPVKTPATVERQPDSDGYFHEPWGKWRPVKHGFRETVEDDDEPRSRSLTLNNPFDKRK